MKRGIVIIAFNQYKHFAYHCLKITRNYTDLPVTVCINEPTKDKTVEGISNCYWMTFPKETPNREVKVQMYDYSPYEETIMMDADSIIQRTGIEEVFNMLRFSDVVLNQFMVWEDKVISLYRTAFKKFGVKDPPFRIYNGAFVAFKKNKNVEKFFDAWEIYWREMGEGRDMPGLACAVRNTPVVVGTLPKGFYAPDVFNSEAVVQHYYKGFEKKFNLPFELRRAKNKSNHDHPDNWHWVNM